MERSPPPGAHVVSFGGELDLWQEPEFARRLAEVAAGPVLIDLAEVRYLDSSFLNALVRLRRRLPETPITVVVPTTSIRRIFAITELDRLFTVVLPGEQTAPGSA